MPFIRNFDSYLRSVELVETRPIIELENCTIGIDVFQWLKVNDFLQDEPLLEPLGGLPLTLEKEVQEQLLLFLRNKITPIFVFNGIRRLDDSRFNNPSPVVQRLQARRHAAWKTVQNGHSQIARDVFRAIGGGISAGVEEELICIFERWNSWVKRQKAVRGSSPQQKLKAEPVTWFRAPQSAAAQLAFLETRQFMVHGIFSSSEAMLHGAQFIVTNIDFRHGTYDRVQYYDVLERIEIFSHLSFVDMCLLAGYDSVSTFRALCVDENGDRKRFEFDDAVETIRRCESGLLAIKEYDDQLNPRRNRDEDEMTSLDMTLTSPEMTHYYSKFAQARQLILCAPVLSFGGEIVHHVPVGVPSANLFGSNDEETKANEEPDLLLLDHGEGSSSEDEPFDANEISTCPPNSVTLLTRGIIQPFLLSVLHNKLILDSKPTLDSKELEECFEYVTRIRQKSFDLLRHALDSSVTIRMRRWFDPRQIHYLRKNSSFGRPWDRQIENLIRRLDFSVIDERVNIFSPLKLYSRETSSADELNNIVVDEPKKFNALLYGSMMIALEYIVGDSLHPRSLPLLQITRFPHETLIAIEMILNKDLNEQPFELYEGKNRAVDLDSVATPQKRNMNVTTQSMRKLRAMRLIPRLSSLLPFLPFANKDPWTGPISQGLRAFSCVSAMYRRNLHTLYEAVAIYLVECPLIEISDDSYEMIASTMRSMPPETGTAMGILMESCLVKIVKMDFVSSSTATDDDMRRKAKKVVGELASAFPQIRDAEKAILLCFYFWKQIYGIVGALRRSQVLDTDVFVQFEDARDYLVEIGAERFVRCLQGVVSS